MEISITSKEANNIADLFKLQGIVWKPPGVAVHPGGEARGSITILDTSQPVLAYVSVRQN